MIALRWTCPKHTRYNPELQGQGGIRGGCHHCQQILDEYKRHHETIRQWKDTYERKP